jgi:sugar phosphate isomerase/epimerase
VKFGICSEVFKEWNDFGKTFSFVKETGYDGIEIAPFTMANYVTDIPASTRSEIVRRAEEVDLDVLGIHWILIGPEGLYLNHPDEEVRDRTARYLEDLARFCGEIGGKIMIFGSPKQRNVYEGLTYEQAFDLARDTFLKALPVCEREGVTLLFEPLSTAETNFITTAEAAARLVDEVNHPNFKMMLDTKAMTTEDADRPEIIRKYQDYVYHYHANDANLKGPGMGEVDFAPIFQALKDIDYNRYVSVEVFNFDAGPEAIARESLNYMKKFV